MIYEASSAADLMQTSYNSRLRDPKRDAIVASVPGAGRGAAREDSDRSPVRTGRCGHAVLYVMSPLGSVV